MSPPDRAPRGATPAPAPRGATPAPALRGPTPAPAPAPRGPTPAPAPKAKPRSAKAWALGILLVSAALGAGVYLSQLGRKHPPRASGPPPVWKPVVTPELETSAAPAPSSSAETLAAAHTRPAELSPPLAMSAPLQPGDLPTDLTDAGAASPEAGAAPIAEIADAAAPDAEPVAAALPDAAAPDAGADAAVASGTAAPLGTHGPIARLPGPMPVFPAVPSSRVSSSPPTKQPGDFFLRKKNH